jgi:hypothetical protein
MSLKFTCPRCHAVLAAPDAAAGKHGVCPRCQSTIEAPDTDAPPPEAPAPRAPVCPHCGKAYDAPVRPPREPRVRRLWPAVVGAAIVLSAIFLISALLGGHGRVPSLEAFRAAAQTITYPELAPNPDALRGRKVFFRGKVLLAETADTGVHLRVEMTPIGVGWADMVLVSYTPPAGETPIRDDDIVKIWGTVAGHATFENADGDEVSVPEIAGAYVHRIGHGILPNAVQPNAAASAAVDAPAPTPRRHRRTRTE